MRAMDSDEAVHVSIVVVKTKVAPIQTISLPQLELCGAVVPGKLLEYCRKVLGIPLSDVFAWTDSTVVLIFVMGQVQIPLPLSLVAS